jgi:hypothetical protein
MTSAIDIFIQFPRPARKNGHPVLSSRFLSRVLVITISSHLNWGMVHWRYFSHRPND